jgi:hypothetical protein
VEEILKVREKLSPAGQNVDPCRAKTKSEKEKNLFLIAFFAKSEETKLKRTPFFSNESFILDPDADEFVKRN